MNELNEVRRAIAHRRSEVNLRAGLDVAGRVACLNAESHYDTILALIDILDRNITAFHRDLGEVEAAGLRAATAVCACGNKATRYCGPEDNTPKCEACYQENSWQ
jgi:hypothetical protein